MFTQLSVKVWIVVYTVQNRCLIYQISYPNFWLSLWPRMKIRVQNVLEYHPLATYFVWLSGVLFLMLLLWCHCFITFQYHKLVVPEWPDPSSWWERDGHAKLAFWQQKNLVRRIAIALYGDLQHAGYLDDFVIIKVGSLDHFIPETVIKLSTICHLFKEID